MPKPHIRNLIESSIPSGIIPEIRENQQKNALDPSMLLPDSGTFWRLDERFITARDTTQLEIIRRVQRGEGFFVSGASYGRKETNAKHTSYWRAFSMRIDNISKSESLFGLLSLLPPPMRFPDKKGHAYLVWLLDRDYSREEFNAGIESLREQIEGIATITPMIPVNPKVLSLKPSSCVSLSVFQKAIEKGVRLLEEAKVGNMALGAPESLMEARNDSEDASMDTKGEELEMEQCVEVVGLGEMETEQEIMGGNKCSFASDKTLDEVKVSLSIYSGYSESEPVEQKLGISVAQALDVVLQQGQPKVTVDKFKAPYWAGEMKEGAWKGKTKLKKEAALAEVQNKIEGSGFVPVTEGVQRSADHCVGASLVKLDLDDIPTGDFEALKAKIEASGLEVVVYTTHSHGVEGKGNRYRVVFVLDRQASVDEFEVVSKFIGLEMLGRTYDASEHKAYQLAGVWAVHPDRRASAQPWCYTGAAVSVDKVLALAGGAGGQKELVSSSTGMLAGAYGTADDPVMKRLSSGIVGDSSDPLPVWDDACYQTLKDALTDPKIHKVASPDENPTQVKVLAALRQSVEITRGLYPDQAVVSEERCKALYVAYASGNTRGYNHVQIEKDWANPKAIGGMNKITPFFIVGVADKLGFDCSHITGKNKPREKAQYMARGNVVLLRASEIEPEPIRWLWEGQLAKGKIHILGGKPGTSKTTLAMKIGATISSGDKLPDGKQCVVGNVLIWSGEDDPNDTLVPRLIANRADMDRVFFVDATLDDDGNKLPFDPARDIPRLTSVSEELGNVALLIVDPIVSAVDGDGNSNSEVRRNLQPLIDLANSVDCAVIGITHFTKGSGGQATVDRITGSLAFGAVARIVHVCFRVKEQEKGLGEFAFMRGKSNISAVGGGYLYDIEQVLLPGTVIEASRIKWRGNIAGLAEDALAKAEAQDKDKPAIEAAKDFLTEHLANGPVKSADLIAEAKADGISESTLRRAREDLSVDYDRWGFGKGAIIWWRLPAIPWPADWDDRKQGWLDKKAA